MTDTDSINQAPLAKYGDNDFVIEDDVQPVKTTGTIKMSTAGVTVKALLTLSDVSSGGTSTFASWQAGTYPDSTIENKSFNYNPVKLRFSYSGGSATIQVTASENITFDKGSTSQPFGGSCTFTGIPTGPKWSVNFLHQSSTADPGNPEEPSITLNIKELLTQK